MIRARGGTAPLLPHERFSPPTQRRRSTECRVASIRSTTFDGYRHIELCIAHDESPRVSQAAGGFRRGSRERPRSRRSPLLIESLRFGAGRQRVVNRRCYRIGTRLVDALNRIGAASSKAGRVRAIRPSCTMHSSLVTDEIGISNAGTASTHFSRSKICRLI
jgi:hypothetical protein